MFVDSSSSSSQAPPLARSQGFLESKAFSTTNICGNKDQWKLIVTKLMTSSENTNTEEEQPTVDGGGSRVGKCPPSTSDVQWILRKGDNPPEGKWAIRRGIDSQGDNQYDERDDNPSLTSLLHCHSPPHPWSNRCLTRSHTHYPSGAPPALGTVAP